VLHSLIGALLDADECSEEASTSHAQIDRSDYCSSIRVQHGRLHVKVTGMITNTCNILKKRRQIHPFF
jgi:hypothetical protein